LSFIEQALLGRLEQELDGRENRICIVVPESDLTAQLFLHQLEYRATQVLRGCYGGEDGYLMVSDDQDAKTAQEKEHVP
jgi:hypothetical protein